MEMSHELFIWFYYIRTHNRSWRLFEITIKSKAVQKYISFNLFPFLCRWNSRYQVPVPGWYDFWPGNKSTVSFLVLLILTTTIYICPCISQFKSGLNADDSTDKESCSTTFPYDGVSLINNLAGLHRILDW